MILGRSEQEDAEVAEDCNLVGLRLRVTAW